MKLFVISVEDKPGSIAKLMSAVKDLKVNYLATQKSGYGRGFIKIVTDNDEKTREILKKEGYMFVEEEIIPVKADSKAESIYELANRLAKENINIENAFMFEPGKLALMISPNDVEKVKELIKEKIIT